MVAKGDHWSMRKHQSLIAFGLTSLSSFISPDLEVHAAEGGQRASHVVTIPLECHSAGTSNLAASQFLDSWHYSFISLSFCRCQES